MFYRGYLITFAGYHAGDACFLITKRHSQNILGRASTAAHAIDVVDVLESQGEIDLGDPGRVVREVVITHRGVDHGD